MRGGYSGWTGSAMGRQIEVIATTVSGSVRDWGKVDRIGPLFREHGEDVELSVVDSHGAARETARDRVRGGARVVISAGGSGTFNSVLEGCYDAGVDLSDLRLGFLRKGSADLLGKVLGMPDEIGAAVAVLVEAIRSGRVMACDVLGATSELGEGGLRRFVGYGGAEVFGEVPRFTENRFMKYYKGFLSQLFGDLGPFSVGTSLALCARLLRAALRGARRWEIEVDGAVAASGAFQAVIIVNGDLGSDLAFAKGEPLGSGRFHVFAVRDLGVLRLPGQMRRAWAGSILDDPGRWGLERLDVSDSLTLRPADGGGFPLNVDGSILECRGSATVRIIDRIHLICGS